MFLEFCHCYHHLPRFQTTELRKIVYGTVKLEYMHTVDRKRKEERSLKEKKTISNQGGEEKRCLPESICCN